MRRLDPSLNNAQVKALFEELRNPHLGNGGKVEISQLLSNLTGE